MSNCKGLVVRCVGGATVWALLLAGLAQATIVPTATVWTWGDDNAGQLGNAANADSLIPAQLTGPTDIKAVAAGFYHTLALTTDGNVYSWGQNGYGQLGNAGNVDSNVPVHITALSGVIAISAGSYFSMALTSDGKVWAWGQGGTGQLGTSGTTDCNVPVQVYGLTNIVAIGSGANHGLAVTASGVAWAWGFNGNGALGNNSTTQSLVPVQVQNLTGVASIAGGGYHSLAVTTDGSVWAWGYNGSGQLGNGSFTDSLLPVKLDGVSGVSKVAAYLSHSLALTTGGAVWSWGSNSSGQVGNGQNADSDVPVQLTSLSGVVAIGAGAFHSLAVTGGQVWTWGANSHGQLGNNSTTNSSVPVQAGNLGTATLVAGGAFHSIAVVAPPSVPTDIESVPTGLSFTTTGAGCQNGSFITPMNLPLAQGQTCSVTFTSPLSGGVGTQYVFQQWVDGDVTNPRTLTANSSVTSYTANFKTQYLLKTAANPTVGGIVSAGGYFDAASTPAVTAAANATYQFSGWTGPVANSTNASTTVLMNGPESVTANFSLNTVAVTVGASQLVTSFTVDSIPYTGSHQFNWNINDQHTIATTTPQPGPAGAQYVFTGWTDGGLLSHTITVTSAITSYTANFASTNPFVTGQTLGPVRNNYSGFVGFGFTVGATPTTVYSLGRFILGGNTQTHSLKLVQANGTDVPNGSVTVDTSAGTPGTYRYAALPNPVTLLANTSYFLASMETANGDQWYDFGPVTTAPIAIVNGPAYTDSSNHYVTATVLPGRSFVPLNFLYIPPTTALAVSIISPAANAIISGNASITVSTTGPVTSLQVQVDGVNQGSAVPVSVNQGPSYTLSLDTTVIKIGAHSLTVVASDAASDVAPSAPVSVTISNSPGGSTAFVLGQTPGPLRNNYTGFVGFAFKTGSTPVVVASLGRYAAPGNSDTHLLKLVNSDGTDVPGGSVAISMVGATAGTFQYATLPAGPYTLQTNTTYYLVSHELYGGDTWYDYGPVSTTIVAIVTGPAYTDGFGHYVTGGGLGGNSYVPLSFLYGPTANTLSATITAPQTGALLSGGVPVSVSTTGAVSSYQLQVDAVNAGPASLTSPITLDTTLLSNGQHTLSAVVYEDGIASATSPGVTVTVNNGAATTTAFTTGQSARPLRNNYTGFVGMTVQVGPSPLQVLTLGRFVVSGNSGTHLLKLVQANGVDVPGGSVTLPLQGATAGQYAYAALPATVTLQPNTTYYVVSQEIAGGDQWFDLEPITTTGVATVAGPTYTDGQGQYVTPGGFPGYSYVPVSLQYAVSVSP